MSSAPITVDTSAPLAGGPRPSRRGGRVRIDGVVRRFGARAVLDGMTTEIEPGQFVALLGRSGTGKSTLLRIVGELDAADEGTITIEGETAVVFQDARLVPWLPVLDNVTLGLDRAGRARGLAVLGEVGLEGRERSWPRTLSGGEAQRAALARALVREPSVLLLDEPFGALDALTRITMHRLLRELCQRRAPTVLLVTHDVDEAILLADRIQVLDGGRIVLDRPGIAAGERHREDPGFVALRRVLLGALGVADDG